MRGLGGGLVHTPPPCAAVCTLHRTIHTLHTSGGPWWLPCPGYVCHRKSALFVLSRSCLLSLAYRSFHSAPRVLSRARPCGRVLLLRCIAQTRPCAVLWLHDRFQYIRLDAPQPHAPFPRTSRPFPNRVARDDGKAAHDLSSLAGLSHVQRRSDGDGGGMEGEGRMQFEIILCDPSRAACWTCPVGSPSLAGCVMLQHLAYVVYYLPTSASLETS